LYDFFIHRGDEGSDEEMDETLHSMWLRLKGDTNVSFNEYAAVDNDCSTSGVLSSEELCDQATQNEGSSDEDDCDETPPLPTHEQAVLSLDCVQRYLISYEVGDEIIDKLQSLNECLTKIKINMSVKQQTITNYFSKA